MVSQAGKVHSPDTTITGSIFAGMLKNMVELVSRYSRLPTPSYHNWDICQAMPKSTVGDRHSLKTPQDPKGSGGGER